MHQRVVAGRGPVVIAAGDQRSFGLRALQDQARVRLVLRQRDRLVEQRFVMNDPARLEPAACGEDHLRRGVIDPGGKFARGETAEHHRMNRADAGAGEHRNHRLGHHRHVENDAVTLCDAEVAQHSGQHLRLGHQPVIGDGALGARERRIVDDGRLVAAAGVDVAVNCVEAGVTDTARKPASVDAGIRIERCFGLFEPVDGLRRFGPKAFGIALPARVHIEVAARTDVHAVCSGG